MSIVFFELKPAYKRALAKFLKFKQKKNRGNVERARIGIAIGFGVGFFRFFFSL